MNFTDAKPGDFAFVPYDETFERKLFRAIACAIADTSSVGNGVIGLRTGETIRALRNVLEAVEKLAERGGGGTA